MNHAHSEIVSAFCDHEAVDPDALARALEEPEARAQLVEFVRFRESIRQFDHPLPTSLDSLRRRNWFRDARVPLPGVAAVILVVLLAYFFVPASPDMDPLASDQTARQPRTQMLEAASPPPPMPTRMVRFEPGVDWSQPTR